MSTTTILIVILLVVLLVWQIFRQVFVVILDCRLEFLPRRFLFVRAHALPFAGVAGMIIRPESGGGDKKTGGFCGRWRASDWGGGGIGPD